MLCIFLRHCSVPSCCNWSHWAPRGRGIHTSAIGPQWKWLSVLKGRKGLSARTPGSHVKSGYVPWPGMQSRQFIWAFLKKMSVSKMTSCATTSHGWRNREEELYRSCCFYWKWADLSGFMAQWERWDNQETGKTPPTTDVLDTRRRLTKDDIILHICMYLQVCLL